MSVTTTAQLVSDMPADEYHAHPAIGSSMLKLAASEPDMYERLHVSYAEPKPEPTPAMLLGTHTHTRICEPQRFLRQVAAPMPKCDRRTKAGKAEYAAYQEQNAGLIQLTDADREKLEAMAHSVAQHKEAAAILYDQPGISEASIFWTDLETGLHCKCRFDWLGERYTADLKTANDVHPGAFARTAWNLSYHIQRAHYLEGLRQLGEDKPLLHIVVKTSAPYTTAVYNLHRFDDEARGAWRRNLNRLAERYERNDWTPDYSLGVWELDPPRWAQYEDEYE